MVRFEFRFGLRSTRSKQLNFTVKLLNPSGIATISEFACGGKINVLVLFCAELNLHICAIEAIVAY